MANHIQNQKAPNLPKRKNRAKGYQWRTCPFADCDSTGRVPDNQRVAHPVTSGYMQLDIRGGHDKIGFVCLDPFCPFFLGTATTPIPTLIRNTVIGASGIYSVQLVSGTISPCVSGGLHFFEM